jgi:hypothetical protein
LRLLANTDITPCGFALPVLPSSTASAASTSTGTATAAAAGRSGLNGGQIAGIAVGSVIGGLLVSTDCEVCASSSKP